MPRICFFSILGMFAAMVASQDSSRALFAQSTQESQFEVLSPWAVVDAIPTRGISPRLESLAGKKIGLFANYKRAALPIATSLEKRLKVTYPDSEIRLFHSTQWNVTESETNNRDRFEAWAKGVDAVILVVGD